jgi:hypothetical protein
MPIWRGAKRKSAGNRLDPEIRFSSASGDISGFPDSIYTAFSTSTCPPGGTCGGTVFFATTHAGLNFGSYSVSATPIPATLPLFISALGGLGFVGWRHRKLAA